MILFPNAKINIGLNIVSRRSDGFHDIETVFFPVKGLCDILEIVELPEQIEPFVFSQSGLKVDGSIDNNLCVKAYHLLQENTDIPHVAIHLHKQIPLGAGLGGGSSDGAFTLSALNKLSSNPLSYDKLIDVALKLGSDCPFFIINKPCYATGRGEKLTPAEINLAGYHILLVNPGILINTGKAYSLSNPIASVHKLSDLIKKNVSDWNGYVKNDFEKIILDLYPEISIIKETMKELGAVYTAMSGSGSTVFGIFKNKPDYHHLFNGYYTFYRKI